MIAATGGRRIPVSLAYVGGGDSLCVSTYWRGWQKYLEDHCAELKGHRVLWRKDAGPYRVELVRSNIRGKQTKRENEGLMI